MTCALVKPTSGYSTFSRFVSLSVRPSILTSTDVSLATLSHHLTRGLVVAKSLEGRRAQLPAARPLDELEISHQLRLHEMSGAWRRRALLEWIHLGGERLQLQVELVERFVRETGADLARIHELGVAVVAHQQCAWVAAPL